MSIIILKELLFICADVAEKEKPASSARSMFGYLHPCLSIFLIRLIHKWRMFSSLVLSYVKVAKDFLATEGKPNLARLMDKETKHALQIT
jgi:hypothetical protein